MRESNNLTLLKELSMPTCATQQETTESAAIYNLILPVPDTDFRDFLDEVDELYAAAGKGTIWQPEKGPPDA
jgi:hypothetical protein